MAARLSLPPGTGTVVVLALGFGLVGIDRFLISTMYPVIAHDLSLSYGDIGTITGALAIAWGIAALFLGNLADRIGRKRIIVFALVAFSLLIGASGLATGLFGLIAVRVVMGFADGAYTPASIAGTLAASPPRRQGLNIGIQQMMMPLFGLGLAPLLVAGVLRYLPWRYVFLLFVIPGLALAWAVRRILPPDSIAPGVPFTRGRVAGQGAAGRGSLADWAAVLSFSKVRIAALLMLCWLTCLVTTSAFMPNYLVDHLHLPLGQMGTVMSAIGLGATVGTLLLPWASDRWGRGRIMTLASLGTLCSLLLLMQAPAAVGVLFGCLFGVHFFNNALITLTVGPVCTDTVPTAMMATASGLVIAVGELFGGGLAPVIVGQAAQRFGIEHVLWLPIAMVGAGILLCLILNDGSRRAALLPGRS